MQFPRYVFKNHGPNERAGGTYSSLIVNSEEEMARALASGWFAGLDEAIAPKPKAAQPPPNADNQDKAPAIEPEAEKLEEGIPEDNAPPTREELEQKCRELGIQFDRRFKDARLAEMIKKALEG